LYSQNAYYFNLQLLQTKRSEVSFHSFYREQYFLIRGSNPIV